MDEKTVPNIVVGRLPLYLRTLQLMFQEGRRVTSSQELGERLGISAAQIREDLSQFGEFGKQGTGYNIDFLTDQLKQILHVNKVWEVAVVGIGDVGHALARYQGFANRGLRIALLFDTIPKKSEQWWASSSYMTYQPWSHRFDLLEFKSPCYQSRLTRHRQLLIY